MTEPMFRIIASTRKPGTCRSCQAAITWATTFPKQKAMPLTGDLNLGAPMMERRVR